MENRLGPSLHNIFTSGEICLFRTASLSELVLVGAAVLTTWTQWLMSLTAGVWWMQKTRHLEIGRLALPRPNSLLSTRKVIPAELLV